ncbi:D-alanine--D-alanine ligase [Ruminococcaceae bacterium OttesenSCG-928-O06]|nr:D-alanine--D-alanine ligase [Ruminococcaceae bacterium OttesenSCG-928-O06]
MAKLRVAVLFGGVSTEHEISLISGAAIADNMDADRYEVWKIGITKKGRWLLYPGPTAGIRDGSWETSPDCVPAFLSPDRTNHGLVLNHGSTFDVLKLDMVFPALHGKYGEDGTVQGLLEMAGIPYVGCGVLASATCMDKAAANLVFAQHGIAHTPWLAVHRTQMADEAAMLRRVTDAMAFPVFVKPAAAGSSIGVTKVKTPEELRAAMLLASAHHHTVLVEEAVVGQEVECAVLGNETPVCTLPGEIISCNEVYDYEAKYESGDASRLLLPANLPVEKLEEVRAVALKAYAALGCSGLSRIDFFVREGTGEVLISEINTMPGFTPISMYPKLMEKDGLPFPKLVDRLVQLAQERAEG